MMRWTVLPRAGAALLAAALLLQAPPSAAYERRHRGDLRFIVGWGEPPAFAGEPNSIQIVLADESGAITAGVDLEVEVRRDDESLTLPMARHFEPDVWGQPGDYRAFFRPAEAGDYAFHFTGSVGKRPFDERFATGDGIEPVVDAAAVSLPAAGASPSPTVAPPPDLEELEDSVRRLEAATRRALAEAGDARSLAVAAIVYGLLALLGGLTFAGLWLRRRRASTGTRFSER